MSKSNHIACNGEFVQWSRVVTQEINELAQSLDNVERLVDVVAEANAAMAEMAKAIETAKRKFRELGPVRGNQWAVMVTSAERTILDQTKAKAMLGDNAPLKTTTVTSVKFGGLF